MRCDCSRPRHSFSGLEDLATSFEDIARGAEGVVGGNALEAEAGPCGIGFSDTYTMFSNSIDHELNSGLTFVSTVNGLLSDSV